MRNKKGVLTFVLLVCILISSPSFADDGMDDYIELPEETTEGDISIMAIPFGQFSCWYSNANKIKYWDKSIIYVYYEKETGFNLSENAFESYVQHGAKAWAYDLGLSLRFTNNISYADIVVRGVSSSNASNYGISGSTVGVTLERDTDYIGYGYYDGSQKSVYSINAMEIITVWNSTTSNFDSTEWKQLMAHEFGHAYGYYGHYYYGINGSTDKGALMYSDLKYNDATSPCPDEISHMKNLY